MTLLTIEKHYNFPKQFEICTIDRILCDEAKQINLRDLPSYFYCSQSLMNEMNYLLAWPNLRSYLLDTALQLVFENEIPAENKAERLVQRSFEILNGLQTVEYIQAMLVLPFQHKRMCSAQKLD